MRIRIIAMLCLILVITGASASYCQMNMYKQEAIAWIDSNDNMLNETATKIWGYAETALREKQSSACLADMIEEGGFAVERGVAGLPTAFVASYGSGKPVIGILAEFDALPGLSQKPAIPYEEPVVQGAPGHGCGHNLFGTGSVAAAMAIKVVMEKHNLPGTIKLFGCPAEETVIGKVYMAKEGIFNDLDACFNWHPSTENNVKIGSSRAMNSFEVTFDGKTAHAASDPWNGRSALDAVELMNTGVNFLREHVEETVRIHYVIPDGGNAPNIVPDYARVWYFVRDADRKGVEDVYKRVLKCAEGAALMTETTYDVHLITGVYEYLPNHTISEVVYKNLQMIGPPQFTDGEIRFAHEMQKDLGIPEEGLNSNIEKFEEPKSLTGGSTDCADVSWIVPAAGELNIVTAPAGIPWHSWAVVSSSVSSIGFKGMAVAAKTLAASGIDVLTDTEIVGNARKEFEEKTEGITYVSAVPPGQEPPLPEDE